MRSMPIKLTEAERLILGNQYEILLRLARNGEEKERFGKALEIVEWGYEANYDDLIPSAGEEIVVDECLFVDDVLTMYEKIRNALESLAVDAPARHEYWAKFRGFHESKYVRYAKFLISRRERFIGFKDSSLNCNHGTVGKYQTMIAALEGLHSQKRFEPLSEEDLMQLFNGAKSGQEN
jgi:uncharacterized protein YfbU (UPF0304 family)